MLSRICPYCNTRIERPKSQDPGTASTKKDNINGEFKGRMSRKGSTGKDTAHLSTFQLFMEYLKDSRVPFSKKLTIIGALIYIISPIDLIPIFFFPLSVLDDIIIGGYLLRTLSSELARYRSGYY